MAEDREGRERAGEDLFEDLDKFFAPIQDVDWPEEGSGEPSPPPVAGGPGERREAPPTEEADLLPEDWAEGIGTESREVDFPGLQTAVPEEEAEPTAAPLPGEDASRYLGEPTSEMSPEDWEEVARRRGAEPEPPSGEPEPYSFMDQFLPDERRQEQVPEFGEPETRGRTEGEVPTPAPEPTAEPPPSASQEPAATEIESEPISIEDLRKPPPEYAGLPGPSEGEVAEPEPESPVQERGAVEPAASRLAPGALPVAEEPPPPGGLERAAEHFAEAIRRETPTEEAAAAGAGPPPGGVDERPETPSSLFAAGPEGGDDDLLGDFTEPATGPRTVRVGAEDLGPSWQEPTSMEVGPEEEGPPPGRNIPAAFLSGIVLALVGLGSLWWAPALFAVVAGAVILLAQMELYAALRPLGYQPATALGLVFGGLIVAAAYLRGPESVLAIAALSVPFTAVWFMAVPAKARRNVMANISLTVFGIAYIPVLASHVVMLAPENRGLTVAVLALAFGYDIVAYVGGSVWGEHRLAPTISPGKTREGLILATLATVLLAAVLLPLTNVIEDVWIAVGVAIVAVVAAPIGDLAESLMKRDLGIKDMSSILPGHGGALDRIDSILFVAPAVFYFLLIV